MPWSPLPNPSDDLGPPPIPLTEVLGAVTDALGAPSVDALVLVHDRWDLVVGDEVAAQTRPVGISGSTLSVVASGPAWASHLRWLEKDLVDRLEELLGSRDIESVTVSVRRR